MVSNKIFSYGYDFRGFTDNDINLEIYPLLS